MPRGALGGTSQGRHEGGFEPFDGGFVLVEVGLGAVFQRCALQVDVEVAAEHDDRGVGGFLAQARQCGEAAGVGQVKVQEDRAQGVLEAFVGCLECRDMHDLEARGRHTFQDFPEKQGVSRVVLDVEDGAGFHLTGHRFPPGQGSSWGRMDSMYPLTFACAQLA